MHREILTLLIKREVTIGYIGSFIWILTSKLLQHCNIAPFRKHPSGQVSFISNLLLCHVERIQILHYFIVVRLWLYLRKCYSLLAWTVSVSVVMVAGGFSKDEVLFAAHWSVQGRDLSTVLRQRRSIGFGRRQEHWGGCLSSLAELLTHAIDAYGLTVSLAIVIAY